MHDPKKTYYSTKTIDINGSLLNLFHDSLPPINKVLPLYCYHTLRISCVLNGRGIWTIGDKNFPIEKGDIFSFNNKEYRSIHTIYPPDNLEIIILDFEPRLIWSNYGDYFEQNFLYTFFNRGPDFENRIEAKDSIANEIMELILDIQKELDDNLPEQRQIIKVKLLNILALLNRYYYKKGLVHAPDEDISKKFPQEINKVMDYIDKHLSENISLNELADMVHMSPSYFSRLFSKINGLGVSQYINKKRIQKSIYLLHNTDMSVIEIAYQCGFNNLANFYKVFKAATNSTPSALRGLKTRGRFL